MTEADTCREFVVPLLQKAGRENDPLRLVKLTDYTAEKVRGLEDLSARWADPSERAFQFTLSDVLKVPRISHHANERNHEPLRRRD